MKINQPSSTERLPNKPPIILPCNNVLNMPGIAGLTAGFKNGLNKGGANRGAKFGMYGPGDGTSGDKPSGPIGRGGTGTGGGPGTGGGTT
jgi:hypothetical protein